jgi:hypothetical protein
MAKKMPRATKAAPKEKTPKISKHALPKRKKKEEKELNMKEHKTEKSPLPSLMSLTVWRWLETNDFKSAASALKEQLKLDDETSANKRLDGSVCALTLVTAKDDKINGTSRISSSDEDVKGDKKGNHVKGLKVSEEDPTKLAPDSSSSSSSSTSSASDDSSSGKDTGAGGVRLQIAAKKENQPESTKKGDTSRKTAEAVVASLSDSTSSDSSSDDESKVVTKKSSSSKKTKGAVKKKSKNSDQKDDDISVSDVEVSDVSSVSTDSSSDDDSSTSSSDSSSSEDEEDESKFAQERKLEQRKKAEAAAKAALSWTPSPKPRRNKDSGLGKSSIGPDIKIMAGTDGAQALSTGKPFQRVDDQFWGDVAEKDGGAMADNSYGGAFGESGYGAKASNKLLQVRGKRFQHEKTKRKRSFNGFSKQGGAINMNSFSTKFKYSDDEK